MPRSVLILGAGFGGLELATRLSEELGDSAGVTLVDAADSFVFGFSKLDLLFGRRSPGEVRLAYRDLAKPGVRFLRETVAEIDPAARAVVTDRGAHQADILVLALGAAYDEGETPGLVLGENEFYSVAGAERLAGALPGFQRGSAVVGVCGTPFKCPPAPSEAVLMLHDYLLARGCRADCEISLAMPFDTPVPPSPETSDALLAAFSERGISFLPGRRVVAVDREDGSVALADGAELPCDLFLGVPRHRAPRVVLESGLAVDGYVPVDPRTLETSFPGVYAIGDVAHIGVPKAGVFSEGAARTVAARLIAEARGEDPEAAYDGLGSCYIEFGSNRIGRVDVDFLSGPRPTGAFQAPSEALRAEKEEFGARRRARWFGH